MNCPIWDTPAEAEPKTGDFETLISARAGGKYQIVGSAIAELSGFGLRERKLLTTWLCEQRHAGVEVPKVDTTVLAVIKTRRERNVTERLNASLGFVGHNISKLGDRVALGGPGDITERFFAETESATLDELQSLTTMLRDMGFIAGAFSNSGACHVAPTPAGWVEVEKMARRESESTQAFVAMWFNDAVQEVYSSGIVPAIRATGYKPMRIDQKEHNNKIDDEIIAEIRRSRFVVADFTCEKEKPRGGVYYEAGFAHGLGLPVIWTCKDTSMNDLHFDTRQYAHIVWTTPDDLREKLKNRIGATIGDGPLAKQ